MMNRLFRNLCHHSMWKYAVLWKFHHENNRLLICGDSYAIDSKSGVAMEYNPYNGLINSQSWTTSFLCDSNPQSGSIFECSIIVAVSIMTRFSYLLGEGIVGKVASMERHQWICIGELNSVLFLECLEELELQVAAGIKTIILLPLLPYGLVQLGSLDMLSEDLTMVAQLIDLFCTYLHSLDTNSIIDLRIKHFDSYMASNRSVLEKYPNSLEINAKLIDPIQTQAFAVPDSMTLSFDEVMLNEHLLMNDASSPHPMDDQAYDPNSHIVLHQTDDLDINLLGEKRWNAMCRELLHDHSEEQEHIFLNSSSFSGGIMKNYKISNLHENEGEPNSLIGQGLAFKNPTMFDTGMKDPLLHYNDICDLNKMNLKFTEGFDEDNDFTTDGKHFNFSVEAGIHKVMEYNCLMGFNNGTWIDDELKYRFTSELIPNLKAELPEAIPYSADELCVIDGQITKYLAQIAMEEEALHGVSDNRDLNSRVPAKSCCNLSGRCGDSCKNDDASNSEDLGLLPHPMPSSFTDFEGFATTCTQRSSVRTPQKRQDHQKLPYSFWRSCFKESHSNNEQAKNRHDTQRPRPRDRQLIQDRIRELRDLIPNASKCSIEALLERTVRHMMFLQNVPILADKLSQAVRSKVGDGDSNISETPVSLPLVVENLEQPDQMLVEMHCRNHGLFLEIAQAIKCQGITILKGILERRLHQQQQLWAHFIVEIPKGFHRIDILWPLMQLLQLKL